MYVINARNVNIALPEGLRILKMCGVQRVSRGQAVIEYPEPVATVYSHPWERVLFDPVRDANPFFHLMETIWLLAGRCDVYWLAQFNARMAEYSDDGTSYHGAYGYRLRFATAKDQLQEVITRLRKEPSSRQAVLQLWNVDADLNAHTKDLPCNIAVMLKVRDRKLLTTVVNRSNDIILGLYGANAVQFSVLHEYLAAAIGAEMGSLTHVSDSFHAYADNLYWQVADPNLAYDPYRAGEVRSLPLITHPMTVYAEADRFLADPLDELGPMFPKTDFYYRNPLFRAVALPMYRAWKAHKDGLDRAVDVFEIEAPDWQRACAEWLQRREAKRDAGTRV